MSKIVVRHGSQLMRLASNLEVPRLELSRVDGKNKGATERDYRKVGSFIVS